MIDRYNGRGGGCSHAALMRQIASLPRHQFIVMLLTMSDNRMPGRYKLHRLGWLAFEDLCSQVLRVVLGETCTRFQPGPDRGRDGWFRGQASGTFQSQNRLDGDFVAQYKHT